MSGASFGTGRDRCLGPVARGNVSPRATGVCGAYRPVICAGEAPVRLDTTATALSQYFA